LSPNAEEMSESGRIGMKADELSLLSLGSPPSTVSPLSLQVPHPVTRKVQQMCTVRYRFSLAYLSPLLLNVSVKFQYPWQQILLYPIQLRPPMEF
jgi:hypothetical protein